MAGDAEETRLEGGHGGPCKLARVVELDLEEARAKDGRVYDVLHKLAPERGGVCPGLVAEDVEHDVWREHGALLAHGGGDDVVRVEDGEDGGLFGRGEGASLRDGDPEHDEDGDELDGDDGFGTEGAVEKGGGSMGKLEPHEAVAGGPVVDLCGVVPGGRLLPRGVWDEDLEDVVSDPSQLAPVAGERGVSKGSYLEQRKGKVAAPEIHKDLVLPLTQTVRSQQRHPVGIQRGRRVQPRRRRLAQQPVLGCVGLVDLKVLRYHLEQVRRRRVVFRTDRLDSISNQDADSHVGWVVGWWCGVVGWREKSGERGTLGEGGRKEGKVG